MSSSRTVLKRVVGDHFSREEHRSIDLAKDIDVVLMRQDPPFDMAYITATHFLEKVHPHTLVVNNPAEVRSALPSARSPLLPRCRRPHPCGMDACAAC